jgi:LPS-assembly protein
MSPSRADASFLGLIFLLILFLLPTPLRAQEQETPRPPSGGRPVKPGQLPINITAERLEYFQDEEAYHADGSVVLKKGAWQLSADHLVYYNRTGKLIATGNVLVTDPEHAIRAEKIELDVNTTQGTIHQGRILLKKENYHIEGRLLERLSEDRYRLEDGSFTTCDEEGDSCPAWRFRARRLRVQLDQYLVAQGVVFYIHEVPVMYLPYLIYPVKQTRQTGLLIPHVGYNTREGFKYRQSFFWAPAIDQDLTPTLDYRGDRGVGGSLEYRYAFSSRTRGDLNGSIFDDHVTHQDRIDGSITHSQDFTDGLQLKIQGQFLNSVDTFRQLSEITEERTLLSLESNLVIAQRWPNAYLYALARYTKDLTGDNSRTIHRLPEIGYRLREYRVADLPIFASLDLTADHLWCVQGSPCPGVDGIKASRLDAYPRVTARINLWDAAVLTPQAGYREIYYSRGLASSDSFHRGTYLFRANLEAPLRRIFSISTDTGSRQLLHLVEPAVLYEYVHGFDQTDIPQLDQLDAFPQKNLVTYSLINRLVLLRSDLPAGQTVQDAAPSRLEIFYLKLTQSYGRERILNLPPQQRLFSDLRAETILRPGRGLSLHADGFLDVYDHRFTTVDADLKFNWKEILLLSVGERYTRAGTRPEKGDLLEPFSLGVQQPQVADLKFLTAAAVLNVGSRVSLAGKIYYDYDREQIAEGRAALRYTGSCRCWGFTVAYIHFTDKNEVNFFFTLKGVSNTESKAVQKLFEPLD